MDRYKHILFSADLVMADDDSIRRKVNLLRELNKAKLSVLHVLEKPINFSQTYEIPTLVEWENEIHITAKERLNILSKELNIDENDSYLLVGDPPSKIIEIADKIQADLIVVGIHVKNKIGRLLLGSTASYVIHHANCDVLSVRV